MLQNKIKILFFPLDFFDYLSDSFLIGLKGLSNFEVYEYTSNKYIYKNQEDKSSSHGMGFTIGNSLPLSTQYVYNNQLPLNQIDLFIFASVSHQYSLISKFLPYLAQKNTILLDGMDSPSIFPFYGNIIVDKEAWFYPPLHQRFFYFKREWIPNKVFFHKLNDSIPDIVLRNIIRQQNIRPISFSIPESKIIKCIPTKTKTFPTHIVDIEVAEKVKGSHTKYAFETEDAYYADLQASKYGITTKRAGWDCMRHYEIAANGSVICFRNLHLKPETCAPHGLIDGVNCINYTNYSDLMQKINSIDTHTYNNLLLNSIAWVKENTCSTKVNRIVNHFNI